MKIVISLGGSLLTNPFSGENIGKYVSVLKKLKERVEQLVIVVGGGKPARDYIEVAKELNLERDDQDKIATYITHANALIIAKALNLDYEIPRSDEEIKEILENKDFLVCGGTKPKQSTDNVAAFTASIIGADILINATNVDGVYDKDPSKNKDAKKLTSMTYDQLEELMRGNEQSPGKYALFDVKGVEQCKKIK